MAKFAGRLCKGLGLCCEPSDKTPPKESDKLVVTVQLNNDLWRLDLSNALSSVNPEFELVPPSRYEGAADSCSRPIILDSKSTIVGGNLVGSPFQSRQFKMSDFKWIKLDRRTLLEYIDDPEGLAPASGILSRPPLRAKHM